MKILHLTSALDGGGVERLLYDYYCNMDRNKFHFDFVKIESPEGILEHSLREMGCKIYSIPSIHQDYKRHFKLIRKILSEGCYDAIHCSGGYRSFRELQIAQQCDVPVRIAHSHTSFMREKLSQKLVRFIATALTKKYATELFACGLQAGKWMWGQRAMAQKQVYIMRNGVNTDNFAFNPLKRESLRQELDLNEKFVIGHVARFSEEKNHDFLIQVFHEVLRKRPNAFLLLIGHGELENQIKRQVNDLKLADSVRFLGIRDDVCDLLSAMDLFVLPSHYEGVPVTLVEAQGNGLPALVSDRVSTEIKINNNISYLPLECHKWVEAIVCNDFIRDSQASSHMVAAGYNIVSAAKNLETKYSKAQECVF